MESNPKLVDKKIENIRLACEKVHEVLAELIYQLTDYGTESE